MSVDAKDEHNAQKIQHMFLCVIWVEQQTRKTFL